MKYLILIILVACTQAPVKKPVETMEPEVVIHTFPATTVFTTSSSLQWMKDLAKVSDCVIKNEDFLKEVESFPKFTHTTKTPKEVADSLRNPKPVILSTYRTKNPLSKVIATTYNNDRKHVYFNLRKNPRAMASLLNTSIHEALHLYGYSHGDNSSIGKQNAINYRIGKMAEKHVKGCP